MIRLFSPLDLIGLACFVAAEAHVLRTARLLDSAGRHFNRGQRAFFFALGYLGWFIGPVVFMLTTALCW